MYSVSPLKNNFNRTKILESIENLIWLFIRMLIISYSVVLFVRLHWSVTLYNSAPSSSLHWSHLLRPSHRLLPSEQQLPYSLNQLTRTQLPRRMQRLSRRAGRWEERHIRRTLVQLSQTIHASLFQRLRALRSIWRVVRRETRWRSFFVSVSVILLSNDDII